MNILVVYQLDCYGSGDMKLDLLFLMLILSVISVTVIFDNSDLNCKKREKYIRQEFVYINSNIDGTFYEMKNTAKTPYPWITARVDINRSNDVWENDIIALMKNHGWRKHINKKAQSKTILCKDGSRLILEHITYKNQTYQFVSLLHDDFTDEDCQL